MKRISLIFCACIVAITAAISCHKTQKTTTSGNTSQAFKKMQSTPQTISVIAGKDTVVYAASGTMLHFYPNSFKYSTGEIITSGTIAILIREMYKPGDMALNGATTTADAGQLASGGQVVIEAYLATQRIEANKYGIGFKQSGPSAQNMQLFYGNTNNADSTTTWTISDTSKNGTTASGTTTDSSGGGGGGGVDFMYVFDSCTDFGWVNCDHFMDTTTTGVSVILPDDSYGSGNTEVFMIFPTDNSVIRLHNWWGPNDRTFSTNNAPVGMSYEIVTVTNKSESYYYWSGSGTVTTSMTVTAAPASETLADIITRMHGL